MNLRVIGCNFRTAPVELREKLAFDDAKQQAAITEFAARYDAEVVLLSTCNRVEFYVNRQLENSAIDGALTAEFLSEVHGVPVDQIRPLLYEQTDAAAVRHLTRVTASLDSLVVGEGQIAGQVKVAFELARNLGTTGHLLNTLFPHAMRVAKRVRTETGIALGHVSISSVAVDFVRQVFDQFADKTILVIGAGKMARLTLKHLAELQPKRILVTNRSPAKAEEVAAMCNGIAVPWEDLDDSLAKADIALSTTGAKEQIMPKARYDKYVAPKRTGTLVVLDIAVPRDFDPNIHDGDRVCVFNIDDLTRMRERTVEQRLKHLAPAEALVETEVKNFVDDWNRRKSGPMIQQLFSEADKLRETVTSPLLGKLNGKLSEADRRQIEAAFRLFQNKLLHGPLAALKDASAEQPEASRGLVDAVRKLFGLKG